MAIARFRAIAEQAVPSHLPACYRPCADCAEPAPNRASPARLSPYPSWPWRACRHWRKRWRPGRIRPTMPRSSSRPRRLSLRVQGKGGIVFILDGYIGFDASRPVAFGLRSLLPVRCVVSVGRFFNGAITEDGFVDRVAGSVCISLEEAPGRGVLVLGQSPIRAVPLGEVFRDEEGPRARGVAELVEHCELEGRGPIAREGGLVIARRLGGCRLGEIGVGRGQEVGEEIAGLLFLAVSRS